MSPRRTILPASLPWYLSKSSFGLDVDVDGFGGDGAAGGGRPGRGLRDEDGGVGRGHADPGVELLPAHAEFAPVVEVGVDAAHGGELIAGPGIGLGHVGRAGEAGADVVGERGGVVHDVGVEEAFFADAGVHGEVELFDGGLGLGPWAVVGVGGGGGRRGGLFFVSGEEGKGGEQNERGDAAGAGEHGRDFPPKKRQGTGYRLWGAGYRVQEKHSGERGARGFYLGVGVPPLAGMDALGASTASPQVCSLGTKA